MPGDPTTLKRFPLFEKQVEKEKTDQQGEKGVLLQTREGPYA